MVNLSAPFLLVQAQATALKISAWIIHLILTLKRCAFAELGKFRPIKRPQTLVSHLGFIGDINYA